MRHHDWVAAAEEEYRRLLDLLGGLAGEDWARPTDCIEWDVRQVVAHVIGAAASSGSLREARRQQALARLLHPDATLVDGMNDVQVRERATASPSQLLGELAEAARRAVRRRRRIPAPVRLLPLPFGPPLGTRSVGYLMDRIYTRDTWLHRVDIARATGRDPLLTPEHDGRLVADIVEEWARAHGRPFDLTLTGPAGGRWSRGEDGSPLTLDAVQFCRILSGRAPGEGLLAYAVPF
jgi:uncharacterized protein (TIGR03083 family)